MDGDNGEQWLTKEDAMTFLPEWNECYACSLTMEMIDLSGFRGRLLCSDCYKDDDIIRHILESDAMEREMRKMIEDKSFCDKIMKELNEYCVNSILEKRNLKTK